MKQLYFEEPTFLGERMRTIRLEFGAKQSDVAQVLHVSRSTYSYYETGTTRPDPLILGKLAHYYNIPIDAFLSEEYPPRKKESVVPEELGAMDVAERSLILLLRNNPEISVKDLLRELEQRVEEIENRNHFSF